MSAFSVRGSGCQYHREESRPQTTTDAKGFHHRARLVSSTGHWVTPAQRTVLEETVDDAVNGRSTTDEAGARVYELLAKAKWENGRAAAPAANKRRAKASTRWVDWY